MEDTSFIDLTKEENLSKINIDRNLIPIFITSMNDFQRYFNYMGYTSTRDYKTFFEKYLTSKYSIQKISIKNKDITMNCDWLGLYSYDKRQILINTNSLESKVDILDTFVHEFIHFLVYHNCRDKQIDSYIYRNLFVEEVLTEILKNKILPCTNMSYSVAVDLLKFWLIINEKEIDFNLFLNEGNFYEMGVDLEYILNLFITDYCECDYGYDYNVRKIIDLIKQIQRKIIKSLDINVDSLDKYEKLVYKLAKRPKNDLDFINRLYKKIERNLSNNLNINESIKKYYLKYLKEYRITLENIAKYNRDIKVKYIMGDEEIVIDKRGKLYKDGEFIKQISNIELLLKDSSKIKIKIKDTNYKKYKLVKKQDKKLIFKNKIEPENDRYEKMLLEKKNYYESVLKYLKFINDSNIIPKYEEIDEECLKKVKKS